MIESFVLIQLAIRRAIKNGDMVLAQHYLKTLNAMIPRNLT